MGPTAASSSESEAADSDDQTAVSESEHQTAVWLLDGFNVLHAAMFSDRDRQDWWAAEHRERLIERVRGFCGTASEIWIVFDGAREAEPDARRLRTAAGVPIYLTFAPSADDWLVRRVRGSGQPGRIAVVTRDQRVGGRARHRGASIVAPARFLTLCDETGST